MVRFIKAIPLLLVIILLTGIASVASAQSQECEAGSAVTDVANNPGLLADCDVLLAARDTLQGDATLNWSADLAIDRWDGVRLSGSPQRVTSLRFYGQRLTGTIPAELGSLTSLQSLTLSDSYLSGPIPEELGSLTNLQSLTLSDNYLSGPIPEELGSLTNLQSLTLSDSYLSGPIPEELGSLASLNSLNLSDNYLSGPIPEELGSLASLNSLNLSRNQLSGPIPAELGSLTNLSSLTLSDNYLSGPIPEELGSLASLYLLNLSWNQLSGTIPAELGSPTNLQHLNLSDNYLSGTIPAELGSLASLNSLNLSRNQLSGPIPSWLDSLTSLRRLNLSRNQLSGPIPTELGSLNSLDLSGNQLSGPIPVELGSLTDLYSLDLSRNQLSGPIPAELGSLANLRWLDLSRNQLSGPIPAELGSLANLQHLNLSGNQLSGPIPPELGSLANLRWLDLSGNQLSGPIPAELGSLANLQHLNLSGNQLSGPIPPELGSLANLRWLHLSGNQLTGCIPHGLRNVEGLDGLSLDFCPDPGTPTTTPPPLGDCATGGAVADAAANPGLVEDCTALLAARDTLAGTAALNWSADLAIDLWEGVRTTGTPPRVTSLDFYDQRLTGKIPAELGSLTNLERLTLSNSYLSGPIPEELGSLTYLQSLSLSGNELTGEIPAELGNLTYLQSLSLSGNELTGTIPAELGSLTYLQYLFLSGNELTGTIPAELGSLTYLQYLDLSRNELTGEIPEQLGSLTYLQSLYLSGNELTGTIPAELGSMTYLKSLSLWGNELTGTIPAELGSLSNLQDLYLQENQLTGPLPQSFTNLTALGAFFFHANAGLCAPTDAAFQNWLQGIVNSGGPNCSVSSLGAPAIGAVTTGTGSLAISWTAPSSDGSSAITAYDLRHIETAADETMDANWTVVEDVWTGSGPLRYVLTGLTGGTQYGVQMRAANSIGDGPWSATATGTPQAALSSPANQRYSWEGSTTVLRWDAVAGAGYYKIYYDDSFSSGCRLSSSGSTSFCEELAANVEGTSYTHTSPDDDDNYYWVTACNSGGCSEIDSENPASLEGSAPAPDLVVDNATVSDSAPAAGGSFTLSAVVRNQGNGSSASTTLRYYRSTDSTITSGDTEVGTDSVSSLDPSESSPQTISLSAPSTLGTYYYGACVDAVDGEANTSNDCSDGVKVTVVAVAPGAPTELSATASGPTEIVLSWNAPAYNGGEAITGYRIEMSPDESGWSDLVADTNSTSTNYTHTGLVLGDTRHYRVSAINPAGTGPVSNLASATTAATASGNASAARSFSSASVEPGGQVTVTITAANYGTFGRVTETLPRGFAYVSSSLSDSQVTEVDARTVRFNLLGNASFTYTVTASSVEDSYSFSGTLRDSDRNEHVVGGAATVTVSSGDPLVARYDANGDGAIDIGELFTAIDDYFAGLIGIGELFTLIDLYFSGPA